jgi:S1-C subfamily serine protease
MRSYRVALILGAAMALFAPFVPIGSASAQTYGGYQKFTPWLLGVDGSNTSEGFVIRKVFRGYPANRLGKDHSFTLEPGDRIVEVNGYTLDRSVTLQKRLGYSSGKVDIRFWDDRAQKFRTYTGVTLVRR